MKKLTILFIAAMLLSACESNKMEYATVYELTNDTGADLQYGLFCKVNGDVLELSTNFQPRCGVTMDYQVGTSFFDGPDYFIDPLKMQKYYKIDNCLAAFLAKGDTIYKFSPESTKDVFYTGNYRATSDNAFGDDEVVMGFEGKYGESHVQVLRYVITPEWLDTFPIHSVDGTVTFN